jgi:hypothetical protein
MRVYVQISIDMLLELGHCDLPVEINCEI